MRIDWPVENPSVPCAARRCAGTNVRHRTENKTTWAQLTGMGSIYYIPRKSALLSLQGSEGAASGKQRASS